METSSPARSGRVRGARGADGAVRTRRDLQAEHARLALELKAARDQLRAIQRWVGDAGVAPLLRTYETLGMIVEREDFGAMALDRIPVVIAQIADHLERLGKLLRSSPLRAGYSALSQTLH